MKKILALLVFSAVCVCMGQVAVFRTVRNLTARPFTASELRLLFMGYGKQNATVEEPGLCPDGWTFSEKSNHHGTAFIMWNATFDVASPGKITFKLSEPDVCSALFVDGEAVAAWKETFPPVMLEEGTHTVQMLVAQRKGERLPKILAYRDGYATKLKYSVLKLVTHGSRCYVSSDCIRGQPLIRRISSSLVMESGPQGKPVSRMIPSTRLL